MAIQSRRSEPENGSEIDEVLRAEREAETAVERAKLEARDIVQHARDEARAIRERTDRRIAAINAGTSAAIERRVAELESEEAERREQLSQRGHDPSVIHRAVERVADWLLGDAR